jgi:hypothetical protein
MTLADMIYAAAYGAAYAREAHDLLDAGVGSVHDACDAVNVARCKAIADAAVADAAVQSWQATMETPR